MTDDKVVRFPSKSERAFWEVFTPAATYRINAQMDEYDALIYRLAHLIETMSDDDEERKDWLKTACEELKILVGV